jgi:3-oxoadipate enol-lactonase
MFITRPDGAEIAWEATGSGPAVLLIMGLAYPAASWFRQVPAFAERHRVLTVDNRGAGDTGDVVGAPYTVEMMAADCLAVLDAAGEEQVHVVGISMGGLMAQEIALTHPERVSSLTLLATHPGIAHGVWPQEVVSFLQTRIGMTPQESREASIPFNYAASTQRALIEQDWAMREAGTAGPVGYLAQGGTATWSGFERLSALKVPTLVVHGQDDRLVVPANGEKVAAAIPDAKLVIVQDANHVLTTDQSEAVNGLLLDWFAR